MWKIYSKISFQLNYILIALLLTFSACSIKNYEKTQSKIITIKTPQIKFSDVGYVRNSDDSVELELFIAGRVFRKISINYLICLDEGCTSKAAFNEAYLNKSYPDKLLQNIILGRAIYEKRNLLKNADGFTQEIKTQQVDINYRVTQKEIYFKDKQNNILFKIKDLNQ